MALIIIPLILLLINLFIPRNQINYFRYSTLFTTVGLLLWTIFANSSFEIQFGHILFGIDGLSLPLILLTELLTIVVLILAPEYLNFKDQHKNFYNLVFALQYGLLLTFLARDLLSFYIGWEVALIPAYFLVGIFGGVERIKASMHFFIYTLIGSLLMLLSVVYLISHGGNSFASLAEINLPIEVQMPIFLGFFIAFFVKAPIIPFHGWLGLTYRESPTLLNVLIAGVMGKMGIYGMLRFLPFFPEAVQMVAPTVGLIASIGIIYAAFIAMRSSSMKEVITYSSLSHVSYLVLGIFSLNAFGITGSVYQMINHGVIIAGLFIVCAHFEKNELLSLKGLAKFSPYLSTLFFILVLASIAFPGTNGFTGEFLILLGALKSFIAPALIAVFGMVFGAIYMLKLFGRSMFGACSAAVTAKNAELVIPGRSILFLLCLIIIVLGVAPQTFFSMSDSSIQQIVTHFE